MEYLNIILAALIFAIVAIFLFLLLDNNKDLKKSNDRVFDIENQILDKVDFLTKEGKDKTKLMEKILDSVQKNERETHFLDKKVDLLTQSFYDRIVQIEKEIKDIKEKIKNGNI